jgi:hypothetical protein
MYVDPLTGEFREVTPGPRHLYIIQEMDTGFTKIGVSRDVSSRLAAIKTNNPHSLEIIVVLKGHGDLEGYIQARLHHCNVRGEWFRSDEVLDRFVEKMKSIRKLKAHKERRAAILEALQYSQEDVRGMFFISVPNSTKWNKYLKQTVPKKARRYDPLREGLWIDKRYMEEVAKFTRWSFAKRARDAKMGFISWVEKNVRIEDAEGCVE